MINKIITFGLLLFFVACANKRVKVLYAKPKALGAVLQVGIVAHDSVWEGRQGSNLRAYLQQNGQYTCLHIQPADTVYFAGWHRNLVYLNLAVQDKKLLDERTFGQTSQYIAPLPTDTTKWTEVAAYIWKHEKERLRIYTFGFEATQASVLEKWIAKHYAFRLRVLPAFQVWKHTPDMLWLKTEKGTKKHIYICKMPQENSVQIPKELENKNTQYVSKILSKNGYQIGYFIEKTPKKEYTQHLEMEAILETWQIIR